MKDFGNPNSYNENQDSLRGPGRTKSSHPVKEFDIMPWVYAIVVVITAIAWFTK